MKTRTIALLVFMLACALFPSAAGAYSYGDPNEEAVAEAYKKMAAELNKANPDFEAAKAQYDAVRQEIDMHMGTEPSQSVDRHFQERDKAKLLEDMQKMLVLNIARRLESIEKDFANFQQNKLLIAKANATYEALSPIVKQSDAALDNQLRQQFEAALQSLGNPGLFGVGVREPDPAAFKTNKTAILSSLQKQFKLESLEVGHFTEGNESSGAGNRNARTGTDLSEARNWIPIAVVVLALAAVVAYSLRKRRR